MPINAQYLIENGYQISHILAPQPSLFRQGQFQIAQAAASGSTSVQPSDALRIDRVIAELSFLSSRKEYWEVGVSLIDFADTFDRPPNRVIFEIPLEEYLVQPDVAGEDPFVRHCRNLIEVPVPTVVAAAYGIKLNLADSLILGELGILDYFQECVQKCKLNHSDLPSIQACIRECFTRLPVR